MASKIIRNAAVSLFPKRMQIVEAFLAPETPRYWDRQEIGHKSTACDSHWSSPVVPSLDEFLAAPWRVIQTAPWWWKMMCPILVCCVWHICVPRFFPAGTNWYGLMCLMWSWSTIFWRQKKLPAENLPTAGCANRLKWSLWLLVSGNPWQY